MAYEVRENDARMKTKGDYSLFFQLRSQRNCEEHVRRFRLPVSFVLVVFGAVLIEIMLARWMRTRGT